MTWKTNITDESSSDSKNKSGKENDENEVKPGATTTLKHPTEIEEYVSDAKRLFNWNQPIYACDMSM